MLTTLSWHDVAVRLLLTAVCAGRRTALPLAMIEANWLINSNGKATNSFIVIDTMRSRSVFFSGIGLERERLSRLALRFTTAGRIRFVTVTGLCFGGGQIGLRFTGNLPSLAETSAGLE